MLPYMTKKRVCGCDSDKDIEMMIVLSKIIQLSQGDINPMPVTAFDTSKEKCIGM